MSIEAIERQLENVALHKTDDALRLFHGRGHCYEGLEFINIDWFSPVIWVVIYGEVDDVLVGKVSSYLTQFANDQACVQAVSIQRRVRGKASQEIVYGELPENCFATEEGAKYFLNLSLNQNVGFFLDAKPGRQWLKTVCEGKKVLNLFSYTCSFSVAAMQAAANSVVNIDMAKKALATGQKNHQLNGLDVSKVSFLPHDIFRSTRKLEKYGPYDVVIIDPPSRQKGSFEANKDYAKLVRKLKPMLSENALLLACLNAPYLSENFLFDVFNDNLPEAKFIMRLKQREDFPEQDLDRCLKMQLFEYKA